MAMSFTQSRLHWVVAIAYSTSNAVVTVEQT